MNIPWICVAYSAPVAAATAVFLIYPIGQGSFSDGKGLAVSSKLKRTQSALSRGALHCTRSVHSVQKEEKKLLKKGNLWAGCKASQNWGKLSEANPPELQTIGQVLGLTNVEGVEEKHPKVYSSLGLSYILENPLRNSTLEIQVSTLPYLKTEEGILVVVDPDNKASVPGVYIIHNPVTNKFWIGESQNIYERIRKHCTELRSNSHLNSVMNSEFRKFGNKFKFYYSKVSSFNLVDRNDRVYYESLVQRMVCLVRPNALYNQKVENPNIQFASERIGGYHSELKKEAGVLQIFCSATNKVYYCHSKNLSQKGTQILNKLKNNKSLNADLNKDWLQYGENSFSTSIVVCRPESSSQEVREQKVIEWIEFIGIENTYNTTKRDNQQKAVRRLNDDGTYTVYPSVSEGARAAQVTLKTFRKWVKTNLNNWSFIP